MAVAAANLTAGGSSTSGTSFATASITPAANNLILASVSVRNGSSINPGNPTLSGNGLTWILVTSINQDNSSSSRRSTFLFRAMGASPSTGAVTITTAETDSHVSWSIDQFSGIDTSGTNGSGAVVQSATAVQTTSPAVTSITASLAAFSSVNNATFGVFGSGNGNAITVGSGFTQLGQNQQASSVQVVTEFKNTNDTTVDFTFASDFELGCIGIEIAAASSSQNISATGIASTATIGTPTLSPGAVAIAATAIASTLALGAPTLSPGAVSISATGRASTSVVGSPTLGSTYTIGATSIASTATLGVPALSPGAVSLTTTSISSGSTLGAPTVTAVAGGQTITTTGISSSASLGAVSLTPGSVSVSPVGITSGSIGSPTVVAGAVNIVTTGIASTASVGAPTLAQPIQTISPNGIASTSRVGLPVLSGGAYVAPTIVMLTNGHMAYRLSDSLFLPL